MTKESILVVIPARGGSKRLPRKNVKPLRGVPLIAYTIAAAKKCARSLRIVVSTNDAEIAAVAREWCVDVVVRPDVLSTDESPIDTALAHAVETVAREEGQVRDLVVWLQPDVPIRSAGTIERVIELLEQEPMTTGAATAYKVTQHPAWMKRIDADGYAVPLQPEVSAFRLQDLPELFLLDGAVVAFRAGNLRYLSSAGVHLYLGPRPRLVMQANQMYSLNVDTAEQFALAERYLEGHPEARLNP